MEGEFIGFTVEGGPIVRFTTRFASAKFPENMELLGFCNNDRPIVAYRKDSIRFLSDSDQVTVKGKEGESEKAKDMA